MISGKSLAWVGLGVEVGALPGLFYYGMIGDINSWIGCFTIWLLGSILWFAGVLIGGEA